MMFTSSEIPYRKLAPAAIVAWLLLTTAIHAIGDDVEKTLFRLLRVTSDMTEIRRGYVMGEVSADIKVAQGTLVQSFWSKVIWNETDHKAENSSFDNGYYEVPLTGDSWCRIGDTVWVETSVQHLTSTLSCHHLPNEGELIFILSLRTLDGGTQMRIPVRPLQDSVSPESILNPVSYSSTKQDLKTGLSLDLKYSFEVQNSAIILARIVIQRDKRPDIVEQFVLFNISSDFLYHFEKLSCTHDNDGNTRTIRFESSNFEPRYHGYHWTISLRFLHDQFDQSLEFSTDFVSAEIETPSLFTRSCSGQAQNASHPQFFFQRARPDCIVCYAEGWPSLKRLEVVRRVDGVSLGTEDSHTVFYQRIYYFSQTLVFVIRTPSDEYSGEYECAVGSLVRTSGSSEKRLQFSIVVN